MSKYLFVLLLAVVLAGCNEDLSDNGGSSSNQSGSAMYASSGSSGDSSGDLLGGSSGDLGGGSGGDSVHKVHNPEPASMLLFGIGLGGLAFLKKRAKERKGRQNK